MKRVIQEQIKRPLAEDLLFGVLAEGGEVDVTLDEAGEGLSIDTRAKTPETPALPEPAE